MPLPVIHYKHEPTREELVRLFHQTEARWTEHLAEPTALDAGTAYANPALPAVYDANNMREVALKEGQTPEAAMQEVEAHFAAQGTRCAYWVLNSAAPPAQTEPMRDHLLAGGYWAKSADIMLLQRMPKGPAAQAGELTIIPARSSFKHVRMLLEESTRRWQAPGLVEAGLAHLDDPHFDALLALRGGVPVGYAGVLAMGEVGRIDDVYVAESARRQGIGRMMIGRMLEICSRSVFRHVMLSVLPENEPAQKLYAQFGFARIGQITAYFAPTTPRW